MRALAVGLVIVLGSACGGGSSATPTAPQPTPPSVPAGVSSLVASMFQTLPNYLQSALADSLASLPRNPQNAAWINAKIALLQRPTLASEIRDGRFFVETAVTSADGRQISMAALFPEERYRAEAVTALEVMRRTLPQLERFMATPFPSTVRAKLARIIA